MHELLRIKGLEAVFCGDDILAIGALDALIEKGVKVPQEMGIIGFNDIAMAAWPAYRLTTIRQPLGDIITAAVDMIAAMVAEDATPPSRRFGCTLVERGTLRSLP
jgi:DNA-binding LacI/PurR family transcriptional regulator